MTDLTNRPVSSRSEDSPLSSFNEAPRTSPGEAPLSSFNEVPLSSPNEDIYKEKEERIPPPAAGGILSKEGAGISPCAGAPADPAHYWAERFHEKLRLGLEELEKKKREGTAEF